MQQRYRTVVVQIPGAADTRQVQKETVVKDYHTVFGFQMFKMGVNGPLSGTSEDWIRIIAGIGYNSVNYHAPYNESYCGKSS